MTMKQTANTHMTKKKKGKRLNKTFRPTLPDKI